MPKDNKRTPNNNSQSNLLESRSGGQNALKGYRFQLLYSCSLILIKGSTGFCIVREEVFHEINPAVPA